MIKSCTVNKCAKMNIANGDNVKRFSIAGLFGNFQIDRFKNIIASGINALIGHDIMGGTDYSPLSVTSTLTKSFMHKW